MREGRVGDRGRERGIEGGKGGGKEVEGQVGR